MEPIESLMWIALGFGPTMAVLIGVSKAGIFRIKKYGREAKIEVRLPGPLGKARKPHIR